MTAPLYERYRPTTLDQVIGQDRAVKAIRAQSSLSGKAYWLAGPSGTGKSTLARIIARLVADDFSVEELDASGLTPSAIQDIERSTATYGMGEKSGRAIIINEAHGLRKDTIRQLLTTLERIRPHIVWIFTTTDDGEELLFDGMDGTPLVSRCLPIPMARRGLAEPMAQRALEIARAEGLDGKPLKSYLELVKQKRNNFRAVLQFIEAGGMLD